MQVQSFLIRLYFIVITTIMLVMTVVSLIDLISFGLVQTAFPEVNIPSYLQDCDSEMNAMSASEKIDVTEEEWMADCEASNERRISEYQSGEVKNAIDSIARLIVTLPLFILHFRIVLRDWKALSGTKKRKK